jgi:transposase
MEAGNDGRYSTLEVRRRAVAAVRRGLPVGEVADAYGVDRTTLFRWLCRYSAAGAEGLQRKRGSGRPRLLEALTDRALRGIVLQPATTFGFETDLWTVGRLHRVLREEHGAAVSRDTVWRRLREAGLTYQKPERQYFELDEAVRKEWLRTAAPEIRKTVAKYRALLYFQLHFP